MSEITIPLNELLDHLFKMENVYIKGVRLRDDAEINVNLYGEIGNPVVKISFQSWRDDRPDWDLELDDCIDLSNLPSVNIPSDAIIRKEENDDIGDIKDNVLFIFGRIIVAIGKLEIKRINYQAVAITLSAGQFW